MYLVHTQKKSLHQDFPVSEVPFYHYAEYSNSFGLLLHCLDDPMEKLLVFRLTGEGSSAGGAEAKTQVVQQLAKLLADSIFSTNAVRRFELVYVIGIHKCQFLCIRMNL